MQRKPGFPVANCNIKVPDGTAHHDTMIYDEDTEQQKKRQQLINFGHTQWGFNNWSWAVNKQDLDFVDFASGKFVAGVVAFVSINVKSLDIQRENIGYATATAPTKGSAIYQARKGAVTNALRETLLSFGCTVATDLMELLEANKQEVIVSANAPTPHLPEPQPENNQNLPNKIPSEPKNLKKEPSTIRSPHPPAVTAPVNQPLKMPQPVVKAPVSNKPFPANQPPRPPPPRPNSNVSFVLPMMGGVVPPMYGPPRMPQMPPHVYPNYFAEYTAGPWHFTYEGFDRHHGNVNLNFNIPPKNLVVNSRPGAECKNACGVRQEGEPLQYAPAQPSQGCWIKPTIFYDGFWTEQKVKRWVAEQVEKQFPEDASQKSSSPGGQQDARG